MLRSRSYLMLSVPILLASLISGTRASTQTQRAVDTRTNLVMPEVLDLPEMPIGIEPFSLGQSTEGYDLLCSVINRSDDRVLGLGLLVLVVDEKGETRGGSKWSERIELTGLSRKESTLHLPVKLRIRSSDRVVLMVEQVIGRETIWNAAKAREALQRHVSGEAYTAPEVQQMSNRHDGKEAVPATPLPH